VLVDAVLLLAAQAFRLERCLQAAMELVAARTHGSVDHAAGAAPELDRVAARLDLELVEEAERGGRIALAPVDVGDVQAVDVDLVLRDGRAAERQSAEHRVAGDDAGREERHRTQRLVHRQPREFLAGNIRGGLGRIDVDAVHHLGADDLHRVEVGQVAAAAQVHGRRAAERDLDGVGRADDLAAARHLQRVIANGQLAQAIGAVRIDGHRAGQAGRDVGHRHLRAGIGTARHVAGDGLRQHGARGQGRQADAHRHAKY